MTSFCEPDDCQEVIYDDSEYKLSLPLCTRKEVVCKQKIPLENQSENRNDFEILLFKIILSFHIILCEPKQESASA